MKALIVILGLLSFSIGASSRSSLRTEVLKLLPSELASISKTSSKTELEKTFKSKLKDKDHDALFLHYFVEKNDVTVGLKNEKFHYLYVEVPQEIQAKAKSLFSKVYSQLSAKEKAKIKENMGSGGHSAGRSIKIDLPEQNLKLEFANTEDKRLISIIYWPIGGERP